LFCPPYPFLPGSIQTFPRQFRLQCSPDSQIVATRSRRTSGTRKATFLPALHEFCVLVCGYRGVFASSFVPRTCVHIPSSASLPAFPSSASPHPISCPVPPSFHFSCHPSIFPRPSLSARIFTINTNLYPSCSRPHHGFLDTSSSRTSTCMRPATHLSVDCATRHGDEGLHVALHSSQHAGTAARCTFSFRCFLKDISTPSCALRPQVRERALGVNPERRDGDGTRER
jgi:hypothetical protein